MKIELMGVELDVRLVSPEQLDDAYGAYTNMQELIILDETLKEKQLQRVLLHELVHATLNLTGVSEILEDSQQEAVCVALENLVPLITKQVFTKTLEELQACQLASNNLN